MNERIELLFLGLWPLISSVLVIWQELTMFTTLFLFLVVPSAYLTAAGTQNWRNAALFSVLIPIPATLMVDPIAEATGTWFITSSFPFRLFGQIPVEGFLWAMFTSYLIILVYERFVAHDRSLALWSGRKQMITKYTWLLAGLFSAGFLFLPEYVNIPYFYLLFGTGMLGVPVSIAYHRHRSHFADLIPLSVFFAYYFLVYELTALSAGVWQFPANGTQFIGWVTMFGHSFPVEEAVYFLVILSPMVVAYYDSWNK